MRRKQSLAYAIALIVSTTPLTLTAGTWNNQGSDSSWFTPENWSGGVIPAEKEDSSLPNIGDTAYDVVIDGGQTASVGALTTSNVNIVIKDHSTLNMVKTVKSGHLGYWGYQGKTTVTIEDGSKFSAAQSNNGGKSKDTLILGIAGEVELNIEKGGLFEMYAGSTYSGDRGILALANAGGTQGGKAVVNLMGTMKAGAIRIGNNGGTLPASETKATVSLNDDSALLDGAYSLHIGNIGATGELVINSGTAQCRGSGGFSVGSQQNGIGSLTLNGGQTITSSILSNAVYVGWHTGSQGTITVNAGTMNHNFIYLGYDGATEGYEATRGAMVLNGGELKVNTLYVGYNGTGFLDIASNTAKLNHRTSEGGSLPSTTTSSMAAT